MRLRLKKPSIKPLIPRGILLFGMSAALVFGASSAQAAWKTTSSGEKMYTTSSGKGYAVGWKKIGGDYYYFNSKGILQTKCWVGDCYVGKSGARVTGMAVIGKNTYYFNKSTGKKITSCKLKYKNKLYYFNKKGILQKNNWINSRYYASKSGQLVTGLASIKGNLYFFNRTSAQKMTSILVITGGSTYYFKSDGKAAKNQRVLRKGSYYYFGSNGKMVKNGWAKIKSIQYYFGSDGKMVTGLQTISGSQYYFNPQGVLITSTTIVIGQTQYTIGSNGVITKSAPVETSTKGKEIVNYALQFVGNRYVYGGNSLSDGTDCSGFTMLIHAHFGFSIPRVANDQMVNSASNGGRTISRSDIQPGDVLCFGYGSYASHVGIYMGNDQFVHASNSQPYPRGGVKISTLSTYPTTLLKIVRYWR